MKKYLTIISAFISLSCFAQVFDVPESERITIDLGLSVGVGPSLFGTMTNYGIYSFSGTTYRGLSLTKNPDNARFGSFDLMYGSVLKPNRFIDFRFIPSIGVGIMNVSENNSHLLVFDLLASMIVHYNLYAGLSCGIYIDSHFFNTKYTFGGAFITIYIQ